MQASDFGEFFEQLHGYQPFAWQQRLVDHIAESGRWPRAIDAPTGAGKSSVIDVHLFVQALELPHRVPRNLAMTVNRRALVDDHWDRAVALQEALADALKGDSDRVVPRVARHLQGMGVLPRNEVFPAYRLRGGVDVETAWRDDPTACKVLCATPDMWGSRLLFRGYGTSRLARPVEAGLLAYDSVVVIDEGHLNQQLAVTAQQVKRWEPPQDTGPQPLQVVVTSATQDDARDAVGVEAQDLDTDHVLARRMRSAKSLTVRSVSSGENARVKALVEECLAMDMVAEPGTIGCVCDTVSTAIGVKRELTKRIGASGVVEALVGRMRPLDVSRLRRERRGLFTLEGDTDVRFLVATQTVEVGVDMDLAGMVTEVAPGSALAQRFGRVNRVGARSQAPITVVSPQKATALGPYGLEDIADAMAWLEDLRARGGDVSPWALRMHGVPSETPRRPLWQSVELGDLEFWADSSTALVGPSPESVSTDDVSLWLEDQLDGDSAVHVVVRTLPADAILASQLLNLVPPHPDELFRVSVQRARDIWSAVASREHVFLFDPAEGAVAERPRPQSGDIIVVGPHDEVFSEGTADADGSGSTDVSSHVDAETAVLTTAAVGDLAKWFADPLPARFRGEREREKRIRGFLRLCADRAADGRLTRAERLELASRLPEHEGSERLREFLRHEPVRDVDCVVAWSEDSTAGFLVVSRRQARWASEVQFWSSHDKVLLADHQRDVGMRAREFAAALGLAPELCAALDRAGQLHDEGKRDERFQLMLGADDEILAKSGKRSRAEGRRRLAESGLPSGWRHEQLSAAVAWDDLYADAARHLVTRLVGVSHGHGRGTFNASAQELVDDFDAHASAAWELFDDGAWDALMEQTHNTYGFWRMAYLEAILRAADTSVSAEGR